MSRVNWKAARHVRPTTPDALWNWVYLNTGIWVARTPVCVNHQSPFDAFKCWQLERPALSLVLGSRGSGKSFLSAIDTHIDSRFYTRHQTRILGGSQAQSKQIHAGLGEAILNGVGPAPYYGTDKDQIAKLGIEKAIYRNGSEVEILTASPLSVRGPHVPSLRMDEVDEIDPEIREAAMGMSMAKHGVSAKLPMTSTWHNVGGPMEELILRAKEHGWPFFTFCVWEVLEPCSEERSGPYVGGSALYEKCPECPLVKWCHAERDINGGIPKAKISDGHYAIDSLIQKVQGASERILEADYFCSGPKADGIWFEDFDENIHVDKSADYDKRFPAYFGLDTGVRTGGIWLQVKPYHDPRTGLRSSEVNIFGDYYAEKLTPDAHVNGQGEHVGITAIAHDLCGNNIIKRYTDPAGKHYNQAGTVVIGEFAAAGLHLEAWPKVGVTDALRLVEALLKSADGTVRLKVHPRCKHVIRAFKSYRRAKIKGVFIDRPEEPQHPQENLIDPIKNTLVAIIGVEGHRPTAVMQRTHPSRIF